MCADMSRCRVIVRIGHDRAHVCDSGAVPVFNISVQMCQMCRGLQPVYSTPRITAQTCIHKNKRSEYSGMVAGLIDVILPLLVSGMGQGIWAGRRQSIAAGHGGGPLIVVFKPHALLLE